MQQAVRTAVDITACDDVVAMVQQHGDAMRGGHSRGERQRAAALFERSQRLLEGLASWIAAARIVERAPFACPGLHEGAGQMNRRHDRAGCRIVLLAYMDGTRAEL